MSGRLPRDATLVCVAGSVRAAAVSLVGVIIAIQLAGRGLSTAGVGLVIGTGIGFSALGTVVVGMRADRWGRRRTLIGLGLLCGSGYTAIAFAGSLAPLLLVAATDDAERDGPRSRPRVRARAGGPPRHDVRRAPDLDDGGVQRGGRRWPRGRCARCRTSHGVRAPLWRHGRRRPCSNVRPVRHRGRALDDPLLLAQPDGRSRDARHAAVGNADRPADSRGRSQADPPVWPR